MDKNLPERNELEVSPAQKTLSNKGDSEQENSKKYPAGIIIVLSFVFGVAGGLYGALGLADKPVFQRWFGEGSGSVSTINQSIVVDEETAITDVVEQAGPAVVSVIVSQDVNQSRSFRFGPFGFIEEESGEPDIRQVGAGTGFFVSSDGMIMTNRHVVADEDAEYSIVTNDGETFTAEVLSRDPSNDLAIMKIDIQDAPFLDFADSNALELGQHVVAIGNSLGEYQNTVTTGVISGVDRDIFAFGGGGGEQLEGVIQTDAAINPGNSGGPLLNLAGLVVGVNTAVDRQGQLVGFAIPANDASAVLTSYQENGRIVRPFLGIRYLMVTPAIANVEGLGRDYGALLIAGSNGAAAILPVGPAADSDLQEGEIILELNDERLTETNSLAEVLRKYQPGDNLDFRVYNPDSDEERNVTITVGER